MDEPGSDAQYSGFWRRVAAAIIDGVIIGAINGVITVGAAKAGSLQAVLGMAAAALSLFYGVIMESSAKQATIGKLVMGIRVTDLNGNRISFLRSLGRQCCKVFSAIILGLGYLFPLFTAKKQALHDMICGCLVIKMKVEF